MDPRERPYSAGGQNPTRYVAPRGNRLEFESLEITSTYLIDENGRVDAVWSKVKVDGHVDRVLEHLREAEGSSPKKKASKKK